jgi:hypothetical protein
MALAASGCQNEAGLTNGPPPDTASEKPATRIDLPAAADPGSAETLGKLGDAEQSGGAAARGGGDQGAFPEQPKPDEGDDSVRATPPADETGGPE